MNIKEVTGFHYYKQCSNEYFCIVFFSYLKEDFVIYENLIYYKVSFKIVGNVNYTLIGEISYLTMYGGKHMKNIQK